MTFARPGDPRTQAEQPYRRLCHRFSGAEQAAHIARSPAVAGVGCPPDLWGGGRGRRAE